MTCDMFRSVGDVLLSVFTCVPKKLALMQTCFSCMLLSLSSLLGGDNKRHLTGETQH